MWWSFMIRFLDFTDTAFLIARKKFGHVNVLHVTHHFIMPLYAWVLGRFAPGGQVYKDSTGYLFF